MVRLDTLNDIYAGVSEELSEVSARLSRTVSHCFELLGDSAYGRDMLRGKLVRPALALMCAKLYSDDVSDLLDLATASELVHIATLIHDDVVDRAEMRRGISSVNARWDDKSAVLSGDRIVCEGLLLLSKYRAIGAAEVMLAALKRVVEGEMRQLHPHHTLDEATCVEVAREKTGTLIAAVCQLPVMWFGAETVCVEALAQFGNYFGTAFQLVDDLLDLTGEEFTLGKIPLSDIRNGKRTLPLVYLQDIISSDTAAKRRFSEFINADSGRESDAVWLSELIRDSGCADRTLSTASTYIARAKQCLEPFSDSRAKDALLNLSDFVIDRKR